MLEQQDRTYVRRRIMEHARTYLVFSRHQLCVGARNLAHQRQAVEAVLQDLVREGTLRRIRTAYYGHGELYVLAGLLPRVERCWQQADVVTGGSGSSAGDHNRQPVSLSA